MSEFRGSAGAPDGEGAFWRLDLSNALLLVSALLLGMYSVVRLIAFQWSPYAAETAMAGALGLLFVVAAWGLGAVYGRRAGRLPDRVVAVLVLWLGLHLLGLFRSPHPGMAVPLAVEAAVDAGLLLGAFSLARAWPGIVSAVVRLLTAAGVLAALLGLWQKYYDLPHMRGLARQRPEEVEDILHTQIGQERLYSEEIFGPFGNANSFAGFLLITMFLQAGLWLDARGRISRPAERIRLHAGHALCMAVQGWGLWSSGSKGAWVAGLAGAWFIAAPLAAHKARRMRVLKWLTGLGVASAILLLVLGTAGMLEGVPFPLSLRVRFEYWRTAWGLIGEQPWLGIGLGGFGEGFPLHKTPGGTETLLAHNDYLQLWAELGVLAPWVWLLFWWVVLRRRPVPASEAAEEAGGETGVQLRTRALSYLLLAGGLLGALAMISCFGRMHGQHLYKYLTEEASRGELAIGALVALVTPLLYAGAYLLLSQPRAAVLQAPGARLWVGARAAVGAILIHQLVDFDMTAQAIMAWLFLLSGLMLAQVPADERPGALARASRWAPPLLAVALLWWAVPVPLFSGQERDRALEDEKDLRIAQARLQSAALKPDERKTVQDTMADVYRQMATSRERAAQWAPYDGTAALDLALAYLQLLRSGTKEWQPLGQRQPFPLKALVARQLERTKARRPRWHGARLVAGHVFLEWALDARAKGREGEAAAWLRKAETEYREATRRYPLNPSGYLVLGDALLLLGRTGEAAAAYREAWEVDRRILDPNVRFASIFHDPLPGCLVKHGRDPQVQELLGEALARPTAELGVADRQGLMVRQLLVSAWRLLNVPRAGGAHVSPVERFASRVGLIHACEGLAEIAPEDGHAALFRALALRRFHEPETGARQQAVRAKWEWAAWAVVAPAEPAWAVAVAMALVRERERMEAPARRAAELQAASVARGAPDTRPDVYEELRLRFGLPAAGGP